MGDAIAANVSALHAAQFDLYAGYVTGSPTIRWTAADFALFPANKRVTIDQAFTGSPVPSAIVRDVQPGAWTAAAAVNTKPWTPARPTIYCSLDTLTQVASAGWKGDVWVALYDGVPSLNFTVPAGMRCVAKQYSDSGGGGAYDISEVFDLYWPEEAPMFVEIPGVPGQWLDFNQFYDPVTKTAYVVGVGTTGHVYMTKSVNGGAWTSPVVL